MKNTFKRTLSFIVAIVFALTTITCNNAFAAQSVDSHAVTDGIDSLVETTYSCSAGKDSFGNCRNVIKLHLKEHDNIASTGKAITSFTIKSNDPDWLRVVSIDNGQNANIYSAVGDDTYPSKRMKTGVAVNVSNHHEEYDVNDRLTYEGGAYIFLVANDYTGATNHREEDRTVSVTIMSKASSDGIDSYQDASTIYIDIDAIEEVTEELVTSAEAATTTEQPAPVQVSNEVSNNINNNNNNNGDGNINNNGNANVNIGTVTNSTVNIYINANTNSSTYESTSNVSAPAASSQKADQTEAKATTTQAATTTEAATTEAAPVASYNASSNASDNATDIVSEDASEDAEEVEDEEVTYEVGDEIETNDAEYEVTGDNEVEYVTPLEDTKTVIVPKTITAEGKVFKVTSIGDEAFKGNKYLTSVTIGANVAEVGSNAFHGCKNLKTITIQSKKLVSSSVGTKSFNKLSKKVTVKVPKTKMNYYKKLLKKKGLSGKAKFKAI